MRKIFFLLWIVLSLSLFAQQGLYLKISPGDCFYRNKRLLRKTEYIVFQEVITERKEDGRLVASAIFETHRGIESHPLAFSQDSIIFEPLDSLALVVCVSQKIKILTKTFRLAFSSKMGSCLKEPAIILSYDKDKKE